MSFRLLLSITFITALVACGGAEERKAVYMEKAKSSIEAGDLDKARIDLKNVLQIDPKDSEAFYQLGVVYEQQKEYRKAYSNYLKAEELNPELLQNQAKLGRFYLLLMNDTDKAQEKIDLILSKEPSNSDGLLLKAAVELKSKNTKEAITITKGIIANNPEHTESVIFLARLYIKENKLSDARNVLDSALKNNQNNEKLNKLLALILVSNKEYERAEEIYKNFLVRNPDNISSYNNLAVFYDQTGNKVKAEEILRASVDNDVDDIDRQLTLIQYIRRTKSDDDAIKELKVFVANQNGAGKLRTALAELYIIAGDKQSAIEIYNKAIIDFSKEVTSITSSVALASIYINEQNYDKASEIIEEAILISPNDPKLNFLRAKLAIRNEDLEKAVISLRIVTKEMPENIDAYILLASVYELEKNKEQVKNTLNSAYDTNKTNADALLKLAQYQFTRDINQASQIIDDYNNIKESDYDGLSIKAAILNQNKAQSEAYKISEILMELYTDKPNGYLLGVPFHIQQGEKQKAISVLEKGYISAQDNRKILVLLTTLQVSEKQFDIVEKRIKAELNASPDDAELKILLSKIYMASNNFNSAESILNEVIDNKKDQEEPYLLLVHIYQSRKDLSSVMSTLIKGNDNVATSIKIPLRLAAAYEEDKDYQKAIAVYRELYQSHSGNLIVINNLASLLSDHSENKDDLELAKILAEKLKDESKQPVFFDTIGWVYYKHGDYNNAIKYLTQVVEIMPEVNVFNYHLGMAYKMAGDISNAKIYLEKSLADDKQFDEKYLAEAALKDI